MANHKNTKKAARKSAKRRLKNRYEAKTVRNLVKELRETTDKKKAEELLPKVIRGIDKNAKNNIIHKNKAANLKSKLMKQINSLS